MALHGLRSRSGFSSPCALFTEEGRRRQTRQAPFPGRTGAPSTSADTPNASFERLFGGLVHQESGGRAGIPGPHTRYGQPFGMTQLLPDTAREMAQRLGMPYMPALLRGTDENSARYQQALGRAYLREGLQRYNGDQRLALMYYHGGPNEQLWGARTHAYAEQILNRLNR